MPSSNKKKDVFDTTKEIRKISRERVGIVPAKKIFISKADKAPKYKQHHDHNND